MTVRFDLDGHIATVTIDRPESMNAIDRATADSLAEAWERVASDADVWVAVLTGAGDRAFCAGVDMQGPVVSEQMQATPGGLHTRIPFDLKGIDVWKPIVAAVNGHAIGAGMEMLSGTDLRVASENATFGLFEARYGSLPYGGSIARLVRQLSYVHAMRLLLTGDQIDAQEALRIGLVNEVVPQDRLLPRAREIAEVLCQYNPSVVQGIKEAVVRGLNVGLEQAYVLESLYGERIAKRRKQTP
ncbi:MAG: enoyl-CoA hydratase-related protein [Dehalococcoidia bacterium]